MYNWEEIRTAYHVASVGTVSGAAQVLGVHHATVIRHIDALEAQLGVKLFQRHARGYTATEAGNDLLKVAQAANGQFAQMIGRIRGQGEEVAGELTVTSLPTFSPLLCPVLVAFQQANPDILIRYLTGERVLRLEYGEAQVAIRAGPAPDQPDSVVQHFMDHKMVLAASSSYVERFGLPESFDDLKNHWFVGFDQAESKAPFGQWLDQIAAPERVVFRVGDAQTLNDAIRAGAGIGFVPIWEARPAGVPQVEQPFLGRRGADTRLHPILPQLSKTHPEWTKGWVSPIWLVTHVDLHRSPKVQAFLSFLKSESRGWDI